jgi:hypothetical protein
LRQRRKIPINTKEINSQKGGRKIKKKKLKTQKQRGDPEYKGKK